jgi:hypothetical protein
VLLILEAAAAAASFVQVISIQQWAQKQDVWCEISSLTLFIIQRCSQYILLSSAIHLVPKPLTHATQEAPQGVSCTASSCTWQLWSTDSNLAESSRSFRLSLTHNAKFEISNDSCSKINSPLAQQALQDLTCEQQLAAEAQLVKHGQLQGGKKSTAVKIQSNQGQNAAVQFTHDRGCASGETTSCS